MTYDAWKTATPPEYEASNAETCDICGEVSEDVSKLFTDVQACAACCYDKRVAERESADDMALQEWKEQR
jgi:hypothetical protein